MSSIVSQESKIMLRKLLADEKGATRVWLRAEVDRFVDPLLDTLFCRLETKLTNGLERTQSAGDGEQVGNPNATELPNHPSQSFALIAQPSPSTSLTSSLNPLLSHFNPQFVNLNYSHRILLNPPDQSPVPPPPVSITNQITLSNRLTNVQSQCSIPIKHESEQTANEPMTEGHIPQSLSAQIVNEQSNQNFQVQSDDDDEEECDCDDCVYGGIEGIKQEDDNDSDSVEWIDDEQGQERSSRPVKKPRLDPTPPNNAQAIRQCSRQTAQPNEVNTRDKQIITVHLQCTQSDCPDTFPEDQLNQHLWEKHFIRPSRCLVKDCTQSFGNNRILRDHIKQSHQHTTQWLCDKCSKYFNTYRLLSSHNIDHHQFGHFQCSYPSCTFTGQNKQKVYNHYIQHKETLKCQHCQYETSKVSNFKQHQRTHLGSKPFRCKWPSCVYAGAQKSTVIRHICNKHLAPKPGSVPNGAQLDPSDYVEVDHDLL